MWRASDLEDEHELVLGAIEASHTAIGLVPDAEVLEFGKDRFARIQQLPHVPPIHAHKGDCPVPGGGRRIRERCGEEVRELASRHLPRRKGELAMADRTKPTDMSVDGDIVGWIGKD